MLAAIHGDHLAGHRLGGDQIADGGADVGGLRPAAQDGGFALAREIARDRRLY